MAQLLLFAIDPAIGDPAPAKAARRARKFHGVPPHLRPGFCTGCGEERCVCNERDAMNTAKSRDEQIRTLLNCCIGSNAAFAKLLIDRRSLSDDELRAIIKRLHEAIDRARSDEEVF